MVSCGACSNRKLNTGIGLALFFLGGFALIVAMVRIPSVEFYTGGAFIALFIAGLFYTWGNAWRQSKRLDENQSSVQTSRQGSEANEQTEQPQAESKT
jgi:hypothetical protein